MSTNGFRSISAIPRLFAWQLTGAEGEFGALINSAGLPPREGQASKVLQVNFLGLRRFTLEMLPRLAIGASIVNVASRAGSKWRENLDQVKALLKLMAPEEVPNFVGEQGFDSTRAYNLSKEAVIVWTLSQCEIMLARGFRMNSISPSAVSTGILGEFIKAFGEVAEKNVARVGRPGTASEVADLIVYLASPESNWIKGQDIVIDGGTSALVTADLLDL